MKYINFTLFTPIPFPRCYIPNLVKIGPVVLEKSILTHVACMMLHDDRHQPIEIGHLSDSGDLKKEIFTDDENFLKIVIW